ncbi:MAG: ferritin-like domain-containing protein [Cyanobacteria bacterium J083]|nr:MAG: ferritin-like domain-containing protein [Cyanobacteria bacterium J083]
MTVVYPRKLQNSLSARDILNRVVSDREANLLILNRYRYNEQRSCKDLTNLIETLDGEPKDLIQDLSHHIADEARHAYWLTDLLIELGAEVNKPPGSSYIDEFERLIDQEQYSSPERKEEGIISALAAINVTEKRGCEYFSAHIYALKQAPQTEENIKIRQRIELILPEEAAHVRWGTSRLAKIARQSPRHRRLVEQARLKYAAIEQAAYESGMDIKLGAELRRLSKLVEIANTLPVWQRAQYIAERLPLTLLAPDLQQTRVTVVQRAWQRDRQSIMEKLVPMFLSGLNPAKQPPEKSTKTTL